MKKIFLIITSTLLFFVSNAQVGRSFLKIQVDQKKSEEILKQLRAANENTVSYQRNFLVPNFGINYLKIDTVSPAPKEYYVYVNWDFVSNRAHLLAMTPCFNVPKLKQSYYPNDAEYFILSEIEQFIGQKNLMYLDSLIQKEFIQIYIKNNNYPVVNDTISVRAFQMNNSYLPLYETKWLKYVIKDRIKEDMVEIYSDLSFKKVYTNNDIFLSHREINLVDRDTFISYDNPMDSILIAEKWIYKPVNLVLPGQTNYLVNTYQKEYLAIGIVCQSGNVAWIKISNLEKAIANLLKNTPYWYFYKAYFDNDFFKKYNFQIFDIKEEQKIEKN